MSEICTYEKTGTFLSDTENIAKITLNRPDARNAFSPELLDGLMAALDKAEEDKEIRAVIITGVGDKAFSAGADIKAMTTFDAEQTQAFLKQGQDVFRRIEDFPKAVIAALNGYAFGGGLEIAMACDIRIASEDAKMGTPEVSLGLIPAWGGTQRLGKLVGESKAREMILTGNPLTAKEAETAGLISKAVPFDELASTAGFMAAKIADNGPLAIAAAKKAMKGARTLTMEEGNELELKLGLELANSKDLQEGITAILGKRKPNFTGE